MGLMVVGIMAIIVTNDHQKDVVGTTTATANDIDLSKVSSADHPTPDLDLSKISSATIKHYGWNSTHAANVENEYQYHFYDLHTKNNDNISPDVEAYWQMHILHVDKYDQDRKKVFGSTFKPGMIAYVPYRWPRSPYPIQPPLPYPFNGPR